MFNTLVKHAKKEHYKKCMEQVFDNKEHYKKYMELGFTEMASSKGLEIVKMHVMCFSTS